MNTRTNNSSIARNVFAVVGAAAVMASSAAAGVASPRVHSTISDDAGVIQPVKTESIATEIPWINPRVLIADFNQDGTVDATDLYDFFVLWNDGKPSADINGDGWVDAEDVWFYLTIWNSVIMGETKTGGKAK